MKDSGGPGALDVAAKLPPSEGVVMFDFAAEEATDLALTVGEVVVLAETEGEWWHGHIVGVPGVVGMFPATYVARGTAAAGSSRGPPPVAGAAAAAAAEVASAAAAAPPVVGAAGSSGSRGPSGSQQRIHIVKGADGYGMGIEDDGLVSGFTFAGGPAEMAGVRIGTHIVAINGASTSGSKYNMQSEAACDL